MQEASRPLNTFVQPEQEQVPFLITNKKRKTIQANVWASSEHPLSISTFLPLLNVLSFSSKQVRKLCKSLKEF